MKMQFTARTTAAAVVLAGLAGVAAAVQAQVDELQHDDGSGQEAGDRLGDDIDVNGDLAIVGALGEGGDGSGAAYIFRRVGGEWVQEAGPLLNPDPAPFGSGTFFSIGVGVSPSPYGDVAVVGAVFGDAGLDDEPFFPGSAYVYRRNASGAWTLEQTLLPPTLATFDFYGFRVDVSGDHAIVGAPNADANGPSSGSFYVFEHDGAGSWTEVVSNAAPSGVLAGEQVGTYVEIDALRPDPLLVVSAPNKDGSKGASYVYRRDASGAWNLERRLDVVGGVDSLLQPLDFFGGSPAISGDTVAVGARNTWVDGVERAGAVYVFRHDGAVWSFEERLEPSEPLAWASMGETVALDGDLLVAGEGWEPLDPLPGGAFAWHRAGSSWTPIGGRFHWDGTQSGDLAYVGLSGNEALVGHPFADTANGVDSGVVAVFELLNTTADDPVVTTEHGMVVFADVQSDGYTSIEPVPDDPDLPANFEIADASLFFDVSTTATVSGTITVCIDYFGTAAATDDAQEDSLALLHHDGTEWVDVTDEALSDPANDVICGEVSSLSPFAVVYAPEPVAMIEALVVQVVDLNLKNGIVNSLDAKLDAALAALSDANAQNDGAAASAIQAFVNAVQAQSGQHITTADAAELIEAAQSILALLEG